MQQRRSCTFSLVQVTSPSLSAESPPKQIDSSRKGAVKSGSVFRSPKSTLYFSSRLNQEASIEVVSNPPFILRKHVSLRTQALVKYQVALAHRPNVIRKGYRSFLIVRGRSQVRQIVSYQLTMSDELAVNIRRLEAYLFNKFECSWRLRVVTAHFGIPFITIECLPKALYRSHVRIRGM